MAKIDALLERYESQDVRDDVLADARLHNTVAKIESGELVLPSETDAAAFSRAVRAEKARQAAACPPPTP